MTERERAASASASAEVTRGKSIFAGLSMMMPYAALMLHCATCTRVFNFNLEKTVFVVRNMRRRRLVEIVCPLRAAAVEQRKDGCLLCCARAIAMTTQ